jgi:tripartite-type tricarboxylate transporter receptor subunit TctC
MQTFMPHSSAALCRALAALTALLCATLGLSSAFAQTYPSRTVTVISSIGDGAPGAALRGVTDRVRENTGATIVFEPRTGGSGAPALIALKRAQADGHAVGITYASAVTLNPFITPGLDFDPLRDFVPVTNLMSNANVIATRTDHPAKDLRDLIAMAKAKPESVRIGVAGAGNRTWLAMLTDKTGAQFVAVPYKSSSDALSLTLGGHIDGHFESIATLAGLQGKLKALAYGGATPSPLVPGVALVRDTVPGVDWMSWFAVIVPTGTPPDRVQWLQREFVRALRHPPVVKLVEAGGMSVVGNTAEEFAAALRSEIEASKAIVEKFGIKG